MWVDIDHDGHINSRELCEWVLSKTKEHFDEAQRMNDQRFMSADIDRDGELTWSEFKAGFLYQHGVLPDVVLMDERSGRTAPTGVEVVRAPMAGRDGRVHDPVLLGAALASCHGNM